MSLWVSPLLPLSFPPKSECIRKFGSSQGMEVWEATNKAFDTMPLAACIDKKVQCVVRTPRSISLSWNYIYSAPLSCDTIVHSHCSFCHSRKYNARLVTYNVSILISSYNALLIFLTFIFISNFSNE